MKPASPPAYRLSSALRQWWTVHARGGTLRACRQLAGTLWDFLRDSTPARRRQRYGDIDYDWDFRVDTTSATVGWRERLIGLLHSPYQPTDPGVFHEMISRLTGDLRRFTFIDLGSGKGRTLLMASDYPFRRIIGVELLPELDRIARQNIRNYRSAKQVCFEIQTICGDAREFDFPAEPIVLYLFNPMPEPGLRHVVGALSKSLQESPREVWILYHNPLLEHALAEGPGFVSAGGKPPQYVLYRSVPAP